MLSQVQGTKYRFVVEAASPPKLHVEVIVVLVVVDKLSVDFGFTVSK